MMSPTLSIFFPAYNDARSIPILIRDAATTAESLNVPFEIIVVNDGSPDNLVEVLEGLARDYPYLRVVTHETNQGYGAALRSGFSASRGTFVFYTDGDAQYDVRELATLYRLMDDATDVVNGYKSRRSDSLYRIVIGKAYNRLATVFFSLPIRDVDCDFRLMRKSLLDSISLTSKSGTICTELIYKLHVRGARFREIEVSHLPRPFGTSQFFTLRRVSKTLLDFARLWVRLVLRRRFTRGELEAR